MGAKSILSISLIAVLLMGIISFDDAFAKPDKDEKKEKKVKTLESECDKKKLKNFDGLFCQAILGFQFTVDSFFDIFVELEDTANFNCPAGEHAVGTGIDGELICAPIPEISLLDQRCNPSFVMVGIDSAGNIICEPLPIEPTSDCSLVNDCSGHGMCVSDDICVCDVGFNGDDCSVPDDQCDAVNCEQLLVINEILFDGSVDGDPNCDGALSSTDDEFVEIVNVGVFPVDLTGFTLSDDRFVRHSFVPGSILYSGNAIVIYGGGVPECDFPANATFDIASTRLLGLNDDFDSVILRDSSGTIIDEHTWNNRVVDQSIVRDPEFVFGVSFVPHTTVSGLDFSPGTDAFGNMISIP